MLPQEDIYYRLLKDYDDKDIRLQLVSVERLWYYLNRVKDITGGGGSAISVSDEGNLLTANVTSFDFTGAGVTASVVGNAVTVNIPGGGGSGTVTSVGLAAPPAFSVSGSPVTGSGTLTFTGAGTAFQYIDGTGNLAPFIIADTWANIVTLKGSSLLIPGIMYQVTDVAPNWQVIIMADSKTTFGRDAEIIYQSSIIYHGQYYFDNNIITKVVDTVYDNTVESESESTMGNIVSSFKWNDSTWANNVVTGGSLLALSPNDILTFKNNYIGENSIFTVTSSSNKQVILNNYVSAGTLEVITQNNWGGELYIRGNYIHTPFYNNPISGYQVNSGIGYNSTPYNTLFIDNNHVENSFIAFVDNVGFDVINNNYLKSAGLLSNLGQPGLLVQNCGLYASGYGSVSYNRIENESFVQLNSSFIDNFDGNKLYGRSDGNILSTVGGSSIVLNSCYFSKMVGNILDLSSYIYIDSLTFDKFNDNKLFNANLLFDYSLQPFLTSSFSNNTIEYNTSSPDNRLVFGDLVSNYVFITNLFNGNRLYNFQFIPDVDNGVSIIIGDFINNELLFTKLKYVGKNSAPYIGSFKNNYTNNVYIEDTDSAIDNFNYNNIQDCNEGEVVYTKYIYFKASTITNFNHNVIKYCLYYMQKFTNTHHNSNNALNSSLTFYEPLANTPDTLLSFSNNIVTESDLTFYFADSNYTFYYDYNKIHRTYFYPYTDKDNVPYSALLKNCLMLDTNDFVPFGITHVFSENGTPYEDKSYVRGTRSTFDAKIDIGSSLNATLGILSFDIDLAGFVGIYLPYNLSATAGIIYFANAPISHPFYIFGDPTLQLMTYYQSATPGNLKVPNPGSINIQDNYSFAEFNLFKNTSAYWTMINYQNVY